jgi:hypothetical protein
MISGRSSETTYEQTENLKPGKTSSVTAALEHVPALEHERLPPCAREIRSAGQPVVPAANDNRVITHAGIISQAPSPKPQVPQ